jgi:hypothetical protein
LDWIGEDLVVATVRWPYLDQNDRVLGEESSSYTLLRGEDGSFKLRVITLRGEAPCVSDAAQIDAATAPPEPQRGLDGLDGQDGTDGE